MHAASRAPLNKSLRLHSAASAIIQRVNLVSTQELKQVIVVNSELGLPKGKLAAQVAHAAVAAFLEAGPKARSAWLSAGMPKVVLRAATEAALQELHAKAQSAGLPVALIEDAGRTVVAEGTVTCVGIGPATAAQLEPLTRELKLL
jgi:peptidyl-tRNA hydrolase, PTH2 family